MNCCDGLSIFWVCPVWVNLVAYRAPIERQEGPSSKSTLRNVSPKSVAPPPFSGALSEQPRPVRIKQFPMIRTLGGRPSETRARIARKNDTVISGAVSAMRAMGNRAMVLETLPKRFHRKTKHKLLRENEKFESKLVAVQSGVALDCKDFSLEMCSKSPTLRSSKQPIDPSHHDDENQYVFALDDGNILVEKYNDSDEEQIEVEESIFI